MQQARQLALSQSKQLLTDAAAKQGDAAVQLLQVVAREVWPHLPASSSPHVALSLAVLAEGVEALLTAQGGGDGGPAAGQLLPLLRKLRDLLDKAGSALKGLSLRSVVTPLLRPLLQQAVQEGRSQGDPKQEHGREGEGTGSPMATGGALLSTDSPAPNPDPELPSLVSEAQAAIYSYVTPLNTAHATKLIKALQVRT